MAKVAQANHPRINLNLLYPQGAAQRLSIRFLKWLISYGRFILVVVEIVVLISFGLRFKLDADLADLKEKINAQVPFIESLANDEALIRQTQLRLTTVKGVYASSNIWQETSTKISNQTPQAVRLIGLSFSFPEKSTTLQFKINAQANSHTDLAIFLSGLRSEPSFQDVSLVNINFEQEQIIFTITGIVK